MLTINYLNDSKQEKVLTYDNFEEFELSRFACAINIADYYKVSKVELDGETIDYTGNIGDLYLFLTKR